MKKKIQKNGHTPAVVEGIEIKKNKTRIIFTRIDVSLCIVIDFNVDQQKMSTNVLRSMCFF